MRPARFPPTSARGSLLIAAMLIAAIIAISLTSYIKLATNSFSQTQRTFLGSAAMNLAEVGLEVGLYSFNQLDNTTGATAWSGWTINTASYPTTYTAATPFPVTATKSVTGFDLGQGATGSVKIYVEYPNGTTSTGTSGVNPSILVRSIVALPNSGGTIERFVRVALQRRGYFTNGLVARNTLNWNGNGSADSWNSDTDNNPATAGVAYASASRTANVVVACLNGSIDLGAGGDVYGYAKTGGGAISNGSVHGLSSTTNDPTRRTTDFSATFPSVSVPSPTSVNSVASSITASTSFPRGGDVGVTSGSVTTYYYNFASGAAVNVNGGGKTITIAGNIVFMMTNHSGATALATGGNAQLSIGAAGSLQVYTNGNISAAGNGILNSSSGAAAKCLIYGTAATSQTISISGNSDFSGCVYAPNADVSANGGGMSGNIYGSMVANTITFNGHPAFHYDDSLRNLAAGNIWGISSWRELSSATERDASITTATGTSSTYRTLVNF